MSNYEQIFKFGVDGTIDIDAAKAIDQLNELSKNLKNFKKTSSEGAKLNNQFEELQQQLLAAQKISSKGVLNTKEQAKYGDLLISISKKYDTLIKKATEFSNSRDMAGPLVSGIENAEKALDKLNQAMGKSQKNLEKSMKKAGDPTRFAGIDLSAYNLDVKDTNAMSKKFKGIGEQLSKDFSESFAIKNDVSLKNILSQETIDRQMKYFQDRIASYQGTFDEKTAAGDSKGAKAAEAKLDRTIAKFEQFKNISKDVTVFNTINDEMKKLDSLFGSFDFQKIAKAFDFDESILDIKALRAALAEADDQLRILEESSKDTTEELVTGIKKSTDGLKDYGEQQKQGSKETEEHEKQVKQLSNTMLNFFSLQNGWNLLQRGARKAFETVKELDAAMTEIAVVSEYSLGDIWEKRSEYSDAATEMGAKTIDLVNATKLYIQQGLDLDESLRVGIETTKMARIANMDGTEATNLMTAALRGFNMEMNEANRVNDVYSQLAAKSAADTREIATALSKTASIANSAGASFENTSAFLTQIIETTRLLKAA